MEMGYDTLFSRAKQWASKTLTERALLHEKTDPDTRRSAVDIMSCSFIEGYLKGRKDELMESSGQTYDEEELFFEMRE